MALSGFDLIWADFVGFGWILAQIRVDLFLNRFSWIQLVIEGFSWIIQGFGWIVFVYVYVCELLRSGAGEERCVTKKNKNPKS